MFYKSLPFILSKINFKFIEKYFYLEYKYENILIKCFYSFYFSFFLLLYKFFIDIIEL